jgi:hypothetical protein
MAKRSNIRTLEGLERRLKKEPREVAITIAARAALRVLPLTHFREVSIQATFRCVSVSRLSALVPNRDTRAAARAAAAPYIPATDAAARAAARAAADNAYACAAFAAAATDAAAAAARAASAAARAAYAYADTTYAAARATARAAAQTAYANVIWESANNDLVLMQGRLVGDAFAVALWPERSRAVDWHSHAWHRFRAALLEYGPHWQVWIDWYEDILNGRAPWGLPRESGNKISLDFLTWPEEKWQRDPDEINAEIAALIEAERARLASTDIPEQKLAPIMVEERDGKIAKISDRDSPLSATERDFEQWRAPVASHLDELLAGDFLPGTNHARMRDRLTELQAHLQGSIADVKENQFKLGYAMTRFASLISAYESSGDDMPELSRDALNDVIVLKAGLAMGLGKLERWAAFQEAADKDTSGAADAPPAKVAEVLDGIAATMEKEAMYFDPDLPRSFRWLAEAAKDPGGATKTVVYGGVTSAENVASFLARRALGLTNAALDGAEEGVKKGVETAFSRGISVALFVLLFGTVAQLTGLAPGALNWIGAALNAIKKITW